MRHGRILTIVVCGALSLAAFADTAPEDAADYRKSVMTSLRGHIGAVSMVVRGLVEDRGHLVDHARGLANGAREMSHLFAEGTNVEGSDALPVIWEEPEAFAAAIEKSQQGTAAFVEVVEGGDMEEIGAAFREVGMSCRGCHDRYRVSRD